MQSEKIIDPQRQQLIEALAQCGAHLRNTAMMVDNYAAYLNNFTQASSHALPAQNVFQLFTPPQSGGQAPAVSLVPGAPNGTAAPISAPTRGRKRRAQDPAGEPEVDENGKRRRKRGEKKPKDPNAPRRPPSAYIIFQNEVRDEMKSINPGMVYHDVLNKISERWSKMTPEQKKPYVDETSKLRAKFETDKAVYDAAHTEQNGADPSASPAVSPTVPTVTAVAPSVPVPAPVPAAPPAAEPEHEEAEEDDEEISEASSGAAVSAAVGQAAESSSEVESSEGSSSDEDDDDDAEAAPPVTKRTPKKTASKKGTAAPTPAKLAASTKADKENKKEKKSKKSSARD